MTRYNNKLIQNIIHVFENWYWWSQRVKLDESLYLVKDSELYKEEKLWDVSQWMSPMFLFLTLWLMSHIVLCVTLLCSLAGRGRDNDQGAASVWRNQRVFLPLLERQSPSR